MNTQQFIFCGKTLVIANELVANAKDNNARAGSASGMPTTATAQLTQADLLPFHAEGAFATAGSLDQGPPPAALVMVSKFAVVILCWHGSQHIHWPF